MQRFIRLSQLATRPGKEPGRWPVSPTTVWRWVAAGKLAEPVQLGPGVAAWPIEVIEAYEAQGARAVTDRGAVVKAAAASVKSRNERRARREQ